MLQWCTTKHNPRCTDIRTAKQAADGCGDVFVLQAVHVRREELCMEAQEGQQAPSSCAPEVKDAAWQLAWAAGELRDTQLAAFSGALWTSHSVPALLQHISLVASTSILQHDAVQPAYACSGHI